MANTKVYPEWVQRQKTKGTTVKKVGNNYYLYKHSSKRVPGKKYPVPKDTYIGKITPNGIEEGSSRKIPVDSPEVTVKEFGFSRAVEELCPAGWKGPLGGAWQEVLDFIIVRESPESYVVQVREVPKELNPHIQYGAQKGMLMKRMKQEFGVDLKELWLLSTIYIVSVGGKRLVSVISDEQGKLLEKLGLRLEAY